MPTARQRITAWSYSRYAVYKKCPFKAKCKYVLKLPEPSSPHLDRGNEVHKSLENFVLKKEKTLHPDVRFMAPRLKACMKLGAKAEEEYAFNRLWQNTGWFSKDAWLRVKIDLTYWQEEGWRKAIDYKTGKEYDDHRDQSDLYALGEFERADPEILDVEFIYLDIPKLVRYEYSAKEHRLLRQIWQERADIMTSDTIFKPKPNQSCKWCAFSKLKGGPCKY